MTTTNALEIFQEAMAEAMAGAEPPAISYFDELKLPDLALARSVWYRLEAECSARYYAQARAARRGLRQVPSAYDDKLTMTAWAVACQMMQDKRKQ